MDLAEILNQWPIQPPISDRHSWLHSDEVGRREAITLLNQKQNNGTFLIRKSQKKSMAFVISIMYEKKFHHFEIETQGIYVFLDSGPYLHSLEHLVDHYSIYADGLPCRYVYTIYILSFYSMQKYISEETNLKLKILKSYKSVDQNFWPNSNFRALLSCILACLNGQDVAV